MDTKSNKESNNTCSEKSVLQKIQESGKTQIVITTITASVCAAIYMGWPKKKGESEVYQHFSEVKVEKKALPPEPKKMEDNTLFRDEFGRIIQFNKFLEKDFSPKNTEHIPERVFENSEENQKIFKDFSRKMSILSSNPNFEKMLFIIFTQESGFDNNAKSDTGAFGIGQLTSEVFSDMKASHRGVRYMRLIHFVKQEHSELFSYFPEDLVEEIQNLPIEAKHEEWEKLREKFYIHRKNPFVNMFLGAMTLNIKYAGIKDEDVEKFFQKFLKDWKKLGIHEEWVEEKISDMDTPLAKMVIAGQMYNGSSAKRNFYFHEKPETDCMQDISACESVVADEKNIYVFKILQKF